MKLRPIIHFVALLTVLFIWGCTPKVTEPIVEEKPQQTVQAPPKEPLSPCTNWNDLPNKEDIVTAHVLYRDQIKLKAYNKAYPNWKKAYEAAPAADGRRNYHFTDGIKIFENRYQTATDAKVKQAAVDTIMMLYDKLGECYGDQGYVFGRRAFDYYYKYADQATDMEKYELFKKSIDQDGEEANYFILNPFTALLSNLVIEEKIPVSEAQEYVQKIKAAMAYGTENCEGRTCEAWEIIKGYVPDRLEQLEGIKGFYDCDYFVNKYYPAFEENQTDCEVIVPTLSKLNYAGCDANSPQILALKAAWKTNCYVPEPPLTQKCSDLLREGDYAGAIECYEDKANTSDDPEKKAQYNLVIAKIYYGELKRFSSARKYARKAAEYKSNWGDPYILIGKLYASSGPLCGPGRGWDSQIVTWPAIDKWQQAKRIDPSVAAEANKLIGRYSQYMPSKGDIFQRNLKEGATFRVPCWIQENTKIRAAK